MTPPDGGGGGLFETVTVADAFLLESLALAAVTVTLPLVPGAVNIPEEEIEPALADHVTAELLIPLTVAVNCCVPPGATVALEGLTVTDAGVLGGVEVPLLPPQP